MGVWPAIFADAWWVSLDIARMERGVVEGWCEEQRQSVGAADQFFLNRRHRDGCTSRIGSGRNHTPGLRDRVDLAFGARRRAERCSIIEVAAPVPFPVPALTLKRFPQRGSVPPPIHDARLLATIVRD